MRLWTSADATLATGGHTGYEWEASGVSIDTRTLQRGDIFIALRDRRDGHDFAAAAIDAGASALVVDRKPASVPAIAAMLRVSDTQCALEDLARFARARFQGRIAAVTGSSGKTSTKNMLEKMLRTAGTTHAAVNSYNNQWGLPLTLARLPESAAFAIAEIGMNAPGEIRPLAELARPHACLVTMIGAAHLAAFRDLDEIAAEKAAIMHGLEPGGHAVVNASSPGYRTITRLASDLGVPFVTFGTDAVADYRLVSFRREGEGSRVQACIRGENLVFSIGSPARHFALNALGALAVAELLGVDRNDAADSLSEWKPLPGRGSRYKLFIDGRHEPVQLIDDAFNANPASLAAALEVLASTPRMQCHESGTHGRRIAIFGDMLELGAAERKFHRAIANDPNLKEVDIIHCSGPLMQQLYESLPFEKRGLCKETAVELAGLAAELVRPGDTVLVKGSKGSQVSLVSRSLRKLDRTRSPNAVVTS